MQRRGGQPVRRRGEPVRPRGLAAAHVELQAGVRGRLVRPQSRALVGRRDAGSNDLEKHAGELAREPVSRLEQLRPGQLFAPQ